jgi:hypothetical protein
MEPVLSVGRRRRVAVAIAVALAGSSLGGAPEDVRAIREARHRAAQDLARPRSWPTTPQPWGVPSTPPWAYPLPVRAIVPHPPQGYDRCLIPVASSEIDPHFVLPAPDVDPAMIVEPRVVGLSATSRPLRPRPR